MRQPPSPLQALLGRGPGGHAWGKRAASTLLAANSQPVESYWVGSERFRVDSSPSRATSLIPMLRDMFVPGEGD